MGDMKIVAALAVLWLLVLPTLAVAGSAWSKPRVPVWDFTPEPLQSHVARRVAVFNAAMPPRAPELIYTPMGEVPCESLPETGRKGGISVCLIADTPKGMPMAQRSTIDRATASAMIAFPRWHPDIAATIDRSLCHELMHAVTGVPDKPPGPWPHPDTSCVQGALDEPGSWDIAYAERVYARAERDERRDGKRQGTNHRARHR